MAALHELVLQNISKNQSNVAVLYDDGSVKSCITYQELKTRANSICEVLRSLGVNNETIGLCMPQNADLPSVILGILQTPGSFYPFDGDGPDFIRYSLVKLHVRHLLVHIDLLQKVDELTHTLQGAVVPCMELLDFGLVLVTLPRITPPQQHMPLAYCITTSGTTSTPKVVRVPHDCIVPNITHLRNIFQTTKDDVCFLASPLTFDPSIVEMFVTLISGATLLITSNEVKVSPERLLDVLYYRNKVSLLQMTPTLLMRFRSTVLRSTLLSSMSSVRVLALGGENFPSLDMLRTAVSPDCHIKFFNLYGITEVSTWATCFGFDADYLRHSQEVSLGPVLAGTKVKVIDTDGHEVKKGEGELLIGSESRVCLLNDETETDISDQTVWRKTGDTVCITEDGNITYIGRHDDQIKRHGKRMDLCAVEHAVQQLQSVVSCKVVFSEQSLLLFLVAKEPSNNVQHASFKMEVTSHLQKTFPVHYQPDELILIDAIPVTKHGKTDKRMLLSWWKNANCVRDFTREDINMWCQTVWKENLNHTIEDLPIKNTDEFLALGGDSLKAVNVISCVETVTGFANTSLLDTLLNRTFQEFVKEVNRHLMIQGAQATGGTVESGDGHDAKTSTVAALQLLRAAVIERGNLEEDTDTSKSVGDEYGAKQAPSASVAATEERPVVADNGNVENGTERRKDLPDEGFSLKNSPSKTNDQTVLLAQTNTTSENSTRIKIGLMSGGLVPTSAHLTGSFVGSVSRGSRYRGRVTDGLMFPSHLREDCEGGLSLQQCWKYDTGKCVDASPLVALSKTGSHIVYTGSHSHAMCAVDLTTGCEVWRTQLGDRVESSACLSHCGRWVVVGCYDNCVYVLCATSGAIKWKYQTEGCVKSSPNLDPVTSHMIIGSHDQCLHAVDIYKERCVWKCFLKTGSVFASPCVSSYHRQTYIGTLGSRLHAVNTDTGCLIWSCVTDKPVFSSPAENQQCVVIGCVDGSIYCFTHQGQKIWTFQTQAPVFSSPTIVPLPTESSEVILVGSHDKHLYCLSLTGEELWQWEADSPVYSSPFVVYSPKQESLPTYLQTQTGMTEEATDNDISLNLQKASLEKKLHFQTEMSNGVTFASGKTNPAKLKLVDSDYECSQEKIYSDCVMCSSFDEHIAHSEYIFTGTNLKDGEPCSKKQKYDNSILTEFETDSKLEQNAMLKSCLCSLCGKRRLHLCLNSEGHQTPSQEHLMKYDCSTLNKHKTDDSNTNHESVHTDRLSGAFSSSKQIPQFKTTKPGAEQGNGEKQSPDCWNKNLKYCHCAKPLEKTLSENYSSHSALVCVASTQGTLSVLDGTTGRPVVSTRLPGEVFSSPVVVGELVAVGCRDDYIYCYRVTTT